MFDVFMFYFTLFVLDVLALFIISCEYKYIMIEKLIFKILYLWKDRHGEENNIYRYSVYD